MPIHKTPKKRQPLWKDWDKLAQKEGVRAPVYAVNGDVYTGEWSDNKKHGKRDDNVSQGSTGYIVAVV